MIEQESEALRKGIEFEGCVRRMFEGPRFDILVQSDEKGSKIPDFYIKEKERGFKFWVEAKTFVIEKMILTGENILITTYAYDYKLNPPVDKKLFDFKPPKGVEIMKMP